MPNWCNNVVEISHADPVMLDRAERAFKEGQLLNEFIPVPEALRIVAGSVGAKGSPEQDALEAQEQANLAQHGYKHWYDFCVGEWGTKWDVGGSDCNEPVRNGNTLTVGFDSAWSPPCDAYAKLMSLGFEVRAYYYEPGMCFAGIWDNGDDDFYEYGDMTSAQVAEVFPTALDEMFGITESMSEYEED